MVEINRRLFGACFASLLMHVALLAPWSRLAQRKPAQGLQIHLAATLAAPAQNPARAPQPPASPDTVTHDKTSGKSALAGPKSSRAVSAAEPAPVRSEADRAPAAAPPAPQAAAILLQHAPAPEYPAQALTAGIEGCVLAAIDVSAGGEIEHIEILAADPAGIFEAAVIEAQRMARYAPGVDASGQTQPSRALTVAEFAIDPGRRLLCAQRFADMARRTLR